MVPLGKLPKAALRRAPALLAACLVVVGALAPARSPAVAWAEGESTPSEGVAALSSGVESPLAAVRERARRDLEHALANDAALARPLLAAWAEAGDLGREALGMAILRHGDLESRRQVLRGALALPDTSAHPLLRAWAQDPASSAVLAQLAAADRSAFADPLAWGLGSSAEAERLDALVELVDRTEIEGLLTSRKSPTGHTGYYRGQYAVLASHPQRQLVLDVLAGIGLDEQLALPRAVGLGAYAPVVPQDVRFFEWRNMALNALGEIATPDDEALLFRLEIWYRQHLVEALELHERLRRMNLRRFIDARRESWFEERLDALGERMGLLADVLTTIYNIAPLRTSHALDQFLEIIESWDHPLRPLDLEGMVPQILIRTGRYAEAIREYKRELRGFGFTTTSLNWYNQACAYACWSRDPGTLDAEVLRTHALDCLENAYETGWRDLGWMEEDGDLDPLRDTPRYQALRARMQAELDALLSDPEDGEPVAPERRRPR
ncbi:MAG: hypothetical protein AB7T63_07670 [Planctomycetota bacterium]